MRKRTLLFTALATLCLSSSPVGAEAEFSPLAIADLQAAAKEYRHRAGVLRKMIGVREQKIGRIQEQADSLVAQARADAEARAQSAAASRSSASGASTALGLLSAFIPVPLGSDLTNSLVKSGLDAAANGAVSAANDQTQQAAAQGSQETSGAQHDADSLMSQAATFAGEKKKLAYKAQQYEQLADAKDLLSAGEILRVQALQDERSLPELDKFIDDEKQFVRGLSAW